jgi:glycosyltransferase 2 family protein
LLSPSSPIPSTLSTPTTRTTRASRWAGVVGLAVTLGLLAWALHGVDGAALLQYVRRADPWLVAATIMLATLTFPLRAVRWRLILRAPDGRPLSLGPLWHATAIGFMANNLLPVRAGEFARAYAARQALPVRFSTALASVGVERVLDGLVLVGLLTLTLAAPSFPRDAVIGRTSVAGLALGAAALFAGVLVIALLVVHRPAVSLALLDRITRAVLPARFAHRVAHAAAGLIAGLDVLRSPGRFLGVLLWSLVLWLVNASSFAVCFRAFGLSVPPESALLLQGIIGFGVALPASPGFVGVFEAATRATLAIYGVDATRAVGYALAYHVGTFFPITLLGLVSLSRLRLHLGELRAAASTTD